MKKLELHCGRCGKDYVYLQSEEGAFSNYTPHCCPACEDELTEEYMAQEYDD